MTGEGATQPRIMRNHHMDSRVWSRLAWRPDDIVIATYAKAGTTWMQQIVAQIVLGPTDDIDLSAMSPWLDFRTNLDGKLAALEAQHHRRFIKTHLPADALPSAPEDVRIIYVARDGRDVLWSMHNHHLNASEHLYAAVNNPEGLVGPPFPTEVPEIVPYFRTWLAGNGEPWWPFWDNVRTWWAVRERPNVLLVHFNDLKRDLDGGMRRIAAFLGVPADGDSWGQRVERCTFEHMKANAEQFAPRGGLPWEGGAQTFINKGSNGRWRDLLTADDIARYEATALAELGPECARWLANEGG